MNTIIPNPDEQLKKVERQINLSILIAIILIASVLIAYFLKFNKGFSVSNGDWGTFGDFIGGTLNPLLAALAFYWLTSSIRLQLQELRETRNVLKETSDHQEKIAKLEEKNVSTQQEILDLQTQSLSKQIIAAEQQQKQIAVQNFESLFFQLLKTKNDSLEDIEYKRQNYDFNENPTDITELKSVDAIKQHIIDFKNDPRDEWLKYYEENMLDYTGSYFRICYQIVKLINQNEILKANLLSNQDRDMVYSAEQKKYFDIFRATLTKHEIEAFFFNCLNQYGNKKFKKLIEKYGLFEPLPIDHDRSNEKNHRLTRYAYQYEPIIFEQNSSWGNYFIEIRNIDTKIPLVDLESIFKNLQSTGIILPSIIHTLLPNSFQKTSGFCYQFNNNINNKDVFNIFTEENLKSIKDSPLYNNLKNEISLREQNINDINNYIKLCISYFEGKKIKNYLDIIAPISNHSVDQKSINQFNQLINEINIQITTFKEEIKILDENLISIQKTEASITAFILIKYGISFTEYCDYINAKQTIDNPPQQS